MSKILEKLFICLFCIDEVPAKPASFHQPTGFPPRELTPEERAQLPRLDEEFNEMLAPK